MKTLLVFSLVSLLSLTTWAEEENMVVEQNTGGMCSNKLILNQNGDQITITKEGRPCGLESASFVLDLAKPGQIGCSMDSGLWDSRPDYCKSGADYLITKNSDLSKFLDARTHLMRIFYHVKIALSSNDNSVPRTTIDIDLLEQQIRTILGIKFK